jgi:hypothetical protein
VKRSLSQVMFADLAPQTPNDRNSQYIPWSFKGISRSLG